MKEIINNVEYIIIDDNKFKTTRVSVRYCMEINNELSANAIVLNELMKMSCKKFNTVKKFQNHLDELYDFKVYGDFFQKGLTAVFEFDFYFINAEYLPNDITDDIVDLIQNVLFEINLDNDQYIELVKNQVILDTKTLYDDKFRYTLKQAKKMLDNKMILDVTPSEEEIIKVTKKSLIDSYEYIMNNSKVFVLVNGASLNMLIDKLKKLNFRSTSGGVTVQNSFETTNHLEFKCEKQKINQAKFVSIAKLNSQPHERVCYSLFNLIFGGYSSSRLFLNIREKLSLAYSISSHYDSLLNIMIISGGISNPNVDEDYATVEIVNDEIKKVLSNMCEDITIDELDNAKAMTINSLNASFDSQATIQDIHFVSSIRGDEFSYEDYLKKIEDVTIEDVQNVAKKININLQFVLRGDANEA